MKTCPIICALLFAIVVQLFFEFLFVFFVIVRCYFKFLEELFALFFAEFAGEELFVFAEEFLAFVFAEVVECFVEFVDFWWSVFAGDFFEVFEGFFEFCFGEWFLFDFFGEVYPVVFGKFLLFGELFEFVEFFLFGGDVSAWPVRWCGFGWFCFCWLLFLLSLVVEVAAVAGATEEYKE